VDNDKIGSSTFASKYTRMREKGNNQWSGTIDEAYLANAPLLAEYGIILCISYGIFNGDTFKVGSKTISDYKSERDFMEYIKILFNQSSDKNLFICGHNIKKFDAPFIFKKMLKHSVQIPKCLNNTDRKPWEITMVDTSELISAGGTPCSLHDCTYLLGLPSPKDDLCGSEVNVAYHRDKDIERIKKYCQKDVTTTKDICVRLFECLGETF